MEQEKILNEINAIIDYCKHEFDINQEAFEGVNDPYADGRYYGAKEAYADVAYKLIQLRNKLQEVN